MKRAVQIVISAGGTGGHVLPAQLLGRELMATGLQVLFVGGGLQTNHYFKQQEFLFEAVETASFAKSGYLKTGWKLLKGIIQSWHILRKIRADLVIGFGSFYSLPTLCAAILLRIPFILFEPNAVPGRVNRLFSRWALGTAIQFTSAAKQMKGVCVEVKMPTTQIQRTEQAQARQYFDLDPNLFTFLVFGGSQGAQAINRIFLDAVSLCVEEDNNFQVIHIVGKAEATAKIQAHYEALGIRCAVKAFEENMHLAWSAANLLIARAGAATVAELVAFTVPGILVPFPYATDNHQMKNAEFISEVIEGAVICPENMLSAAYLYELIKQLRQPDTLATMRRKLAEFKLGESKIDLQTFVYSYIF